MGFEQITDENLILAELKQEGLLEQFKENKDMRIYNADKLTIYVYFAEFDKTGKKRKEADRGYVMYKAQDKSIYDVLVGFVSSM